MKNVRLLDGAMGTELMARGLALGTATILWNLTEPEKVAEVHRTYMRAGSQAVLTNTFGGSALALKRYGLAHRMRELNLRGAEIARSAAGPERIVFGDIGPCTELMEPYGDLTTDDVSDSAFSQGLALKEGGVNCFLIETVADLSEVTATIDGLLPHKLPIWATYTFDRTPEGPRTMLGSTPLEAVSAAFAAGAYGSGANCGTSLTLNDYLEIGASLAQAFPGQPLMLQPNAGQPEMTPDGPMYRTDADDFAKFAEQAWSMGIQVVGGCCGTRSCHVEGMASRLLKPSE